jgi:hypothetical protein
MRKLAILVITLFSVGFVACTKSEPPTKEPMTQENTDPSAVGNPQAPNPSGLTGAPNSGASNPNPGGKQQTNPDAMGGSAPSK